MEIMRNKGDDKIFFRDIDMSVWKETSKEERARLVPVLDILVGNTESYTHWICYSLTVEEFEAITGIKP